MAQEKPIKGPDGDGDFVTSEQAGNFLGGISGPQFDALVKRLTPWLEPVYLAKDAKRWRWIDVAYLAVFIPRLQTRMQGTSKANDEKSTDFPTSRKRPETSGNQPNG